MKAYLVVIILTIAAILSVIYIGWLAEWFVHWWNEAEMF
ncbi:Uncharacterised protein [Yersinia frederiksenii]|nr:Uncharacterised protein [Yersinia frederiksenii]